MDDKYPDQGIEQEAQDPDPERAGRRAPADGDTLPLAGGLPPTGDDRVDAAVAGLSRLAGAQEEEHVAVLEEVHGRLRDILGEASEGPP
jgi:molybdopterin-biosynthesis enzyme MoeA-like protein